MTGMKRLMAAGVASLALFGAVSMTATPASAWWRGGWGPGPFVGGLAAGAIIGSAIAPRYAYPPVAYYGAPYPSCMRRVWGPYGWHWARYC